MATTKEQLLNILAEHQGREAGIQGNALARKAGLSPRRLRTLISQMRDQGIAICGKPASGYFVPVSAEELSESCAYLEARALHSLRLLSRMKKVALPTLLGQLLITGKEG